MTASTLRSPLGLNKGNERRNRGVPSEGGGEWKVVATSMHDDVFLDSDRMSRVRDRSR